MWSKGEWCTRWIWTFGEDQINSAKLTKQQADGQVRQNDCGGEKCLKPAVMQKRRMDAVEYKPYSAFFGFKNWSVNGQESL